MTEILTRTMDLVHEYDEETHVHTFSFDTTYPVKVSGNIIKTFVATAPLHKDDIFVVDNGGGMFTTIPWSHIYGFRQQLNEEEYFEIGDPVMVLFTLTTNGDPGTATICNMSPVSDTSNQGLYIKYMCNGIDDSKKLKDALATLYNAEDGDTVEVLGCQITAGVARDVVIDITGKFTLTPQSMYVHDNETFGRERFISYCNIAPTNPNPFFSVRLDFTKAIIDDSTVVMDIMAAAQVDPEIGVSKTGYHAYLFSYGDCECNPKLFVNGLRIDSRYLGLFTSMMEPAERESSDPTYVTIEAPYAKFSGIRYVDTSSSGHYTSPYVIKRPAPILIDNMKSHTIVDIDDLYCVDISNERFNFIVNSGKCNINKMTMYYGIPDVSTTAGFKMHHIAGTLDSLVVNCLTTYDSNPLRRYTSTVTDEEMDARHIECDRRNIKTAQGFGYIYDELSLADIADEDEVPELNIANSEYHVIYHNIVSNIGGELSVKSTTFGLEVLDRESEHCNENSAIMTYGGTVSVYTTDFTLTGGNHGTYGIHAMPIRNAVGAANYTAANVTCSGSRFSFISDDLVWQPDLNSWETKSTYQKCERCMRSALCAFNISAYDPANVLDYIVEDGVPVFNTTGTIGLVTITSCDFSVSDRDRVPANRMNSLSSCGMPLEIIFGECILFGKGTTQYKINGCTTGMNFESDGTSFSNCPNIGIHIINTTDRGGLMLTDSVINCAYAPVRFIPYLDEFNSRQIIYTLMKGVYTAEADFADFDKNGTVGASDAACGKIVLENRRCPKINVANCTIKNGFAYYGDMPTTLGQQSPNSKFPFSIPHFYESGSTYAQLRTKIIPGLYAEKIPTSSFNNIVFECGSIWINPVATDSIVTVSGCDCMGTFVSGCLIGLRANSHGWHHGAILACLDSDCNDADAVLRLENCNFHKHCMMMPTVNTVLSSSPMDKIYKDSDHTKLRVIYPEYLAPDTPTLADLEYSGVVLSNIPELIIDSCEFLSDGRAVRIINNPEYSYGNESCDGTGSTDWNISMPKINSVTFRNNAIKSVNDLTLASGIESSLFVYGGCDLDVENNLFLSSGKHTFVNICLQSFGLNNGHMYNIQSLPFDFKMSGNKLCACKYDNDGTRERASGDPYGPYTKQMILDDVNNVSRHKGDDLNFLMVYSANLIMLTSGIKFDIRDNYFYKTRGTVGTREGVVSKAIDSLAAPLLEFTTNQMGVLTEDVSTTRALLSGRSIIMGYGGVETSQTGYRAFREFYARGTIKDNYMGPLEGDKLIPISDHVASNAYDGFQGASFKDCSADFTLQTGGEELDPDKDQWFDVDVKCSGNTYGPSLLMSTYNDMSDPYKFNIDTKRFFK